MRVLIALSLSLFAAACVTSQKEAHAAAAEQVAWLDGLDARYEAFSRPLALAEWSRAVGEPAGDTAEAERAQAAFFSDAELSRRLSELSKASDPEVARRASAWLRFIGRERLFASPELQRADEQIALAANPEGQPTAIGLIMDLFRSRDPKVRWAAVARIEQRSQAVLPLIRARGQVLDAQARAVGVADGLSYVVGPGAKARLERVCREQVGRTAADWQQALRIVERRMNGRPTVADYAAEIIAEGADAGAFFSARRLPELSRSALAQMGFDLPSMRILIKVNPNTIGGSAFDISIPDDVRFQGNFSEDGFDSARGYFHEMGHAIHMKRVRAAHLPERALPEDRGLREGIAEIFAAIPRERSWLRAQFPEVSVADLERFGRSARAFDALAVRLNCLTARLEVEAATGGDLEKSWRPMYEETFGVIPPVGPTWILFHPGYLSTPFYMIGYVNSAEVRDTFLGRLGGAPLLSPEAGRQLDETLLAPGAALTLEGYLGG